MTPRTALIAAAALLVVTTPVGGGLAVGGLGAAALGVSMWVESDATDPSSEATAEAPVDAWEPCDLDAVETAWSGDDPDHAATVLAACLEAGGLDDERLDEVGERQQRLAEARTALDAAEDALGRGACRSSARELDGLADLPSLDPLRQRTTECGRLALRREIASSQARLQEALEPFDVSFEPVGAGVYDIVVSGSTYEWHGGAESVDDRVTFALAVVGAESSRTTWRSRNAVVLVGTDTVTLPTSELRDAMDPEFRTAVTRALDAG